MKIFEQDTYTTCCAGPDEWDEVKKHWDHDLEVSILDLRTVLEVQDSDIEEVPEKWEYRRMAVVGETISEQDVDVFRREQRRHGRLAVISPSETRGSLLCLTDLARLDRGPLPKDKLKELKGLKKEKVLQKWLDAYLKRHKSTDEMGDTT